MSGSGTPARGSSTTVALGIESDCGIPAGGLVQYPTIPPAALALTRGYEANPSLNPSGFRVRGTPALVDGSGADIAIATDTARSLELFHHLVGSAVRTEEEAGAVFSYLCTPPPLGVRPSTTLWGLIA